MKINDNISIEHLQLWRFENARPSGTLRKLKPKNARNEKTDRLEAMALARADYDQEKARIKREEEQDECPHDEHDHYVCLECGKQLDVGEFIDRAMDFMEEKYDIPNN